MKIRLPGRKSGNVIDKRGQTASGGGTALPMGGLAGMGIPGIIILVGILVFTQFMGGGGGGFGVDPPLETNPAVPAASGAVPESDQLLEFVSFVFDDVQATWDEQFASSGEDYRDARLIIFTDGVDTACGFASSATGPFYCPADEQVYIDFGFYGELATRFDAPGDFAQAYVLAHEVGHHVQHVTGISDEVRRLQQQNPETPTSSRSGSSFRPTAWPACGGTRPPSGASWKTATSRRASPPRPPFGDDRIQQAGTGRVNQETWTHGSSEQRVAWFRRGFDRGDASQCNTFEGDV